MSFDQATDIVRESLLVMLMLSTPILLAGLVIGLFISILQAVTQIQEQTLSFVPKILGMGLVAVLLTPWVARMLLDFSARMFSGAG
ncbi:MAG: flagellar biosynthesis protein FliQ [Phycisphaeraceae bacterium]|nr:flagellar biosynthesis protein FliQ [Phycisphaeraceae bacterium]